jgi:hypothetical protein
VPLCVCVYLYWYFGPPCVSWSVSIWVINCHLGFPWLLVFQGVCVCACALVCMRYICFPGFNSCEVCSGWVSCCHRCLTCFKGLCCVCTQVSGSMVSNWPWCEFWTCVLWFLVYIFFIPQFFETPDDGQSPKVQFVQYQHTVVRILQKLWKLKFKCKI